MNLHLMRNGSFTVGVLVAFCFFLGVPAFFFILMLYLQIGLGYPPLPAALTLVPFALSSAFGSADSARLLPRFGKKILYAGPLLLVLGMGGIVLAIREAGVSLSGWDLIVPLLFSGTGLGITVAPLVNWRRSA